MIDLEFATLDDIVAELRRREMHFALYVNLLPQSAREAIAVVHGDTAPARAMLEQEGFRYEGYVDIFDAGPTVECFRDNIHAIRQSIVTPAAITAASAAAHPPNGSLVWMITNRRFKDFRVILAAAPARFERFPLAREAAAQLVVAEGDTVRAVPLSPRDRR